MAERPGFTMLATALLLALPTGAAAQERASDTQTSRLDLADGPYVTPQDGGWFARSVNAEGDAQDGAVHDGRIHVPAVGSLPGFAVALRPPPPIAPSIEPLAKMTPLLVLADTHGEYPIRVALLKAQGIIDDQLRWSFGKGHFTISGDMLDRGPHQLEILWLFYKLEAEAKAAGGRVHVVIGNHEAMVLRGDQRYLNPRYPEIARRLGVPAYSHLLGADTVLGAWLRSRPAMLKLGDQLILHGGVSPELVATGLGLDAINAISRRYLDIPHDQRPPEGSNDALVTGNDGPLWYRGYFPMRDQPPAAGEADVDASLERFDVARILVGHTIVEKVTPLYGGKVIAVQVYPHLDETNGLPILEGAMRLKGKWYRVTAQGERTKLDRAR